MRATLIAMWWMIGAAQAAPPTAPATRPGNSETMDEFTVEGQHYVITTKVDQHSAQVWAVGQLSDPAWQLVKDALDTDRVIWSPDTTPRMFCLFSRAASSELYWMGRWDTPVLDTSSGLPGGVQSVGMLWPRPDRPATRDWFGIAAAVGSPTTWHLFQVADKEHWTSLVLDGTTAPITGFLRLARGEIAVASADHIWRLYRHDDDAIWRPFALPKAPRELADASLFDGDLGLRVRFPSERDAKRAHFYHRGANGDWVALETLVPGAPAPIYAVRGFGPGRALAIQNQPVAGRDNAAWDASFFVVDKGGRWTPLAKLLPGVRARVDSVRAFAKGRGLAVRGQPDSRSETPDEWKYFWRSDDGTWTTLASVVKAMPARTWDVVSFAEDRGLGFRARGSEPTKGVYEATWYLRNAAGPAWQALGKVLPGAPVSIVSVTGDNAAAGLRIADADDPAPRWFVPDGTGWIDAAQLLPKQPIVQVRATRPDLVWIEEDRRRIHWYRRGSDGRWRVLPALEP
jgi:hypothetical protein